MNMSDDAVIDIRNEDIADNLNNILENSSIFKSNSNIDYLRCIIFYLDDKDIISYKKHEIKISNNMLSKTELMTLILNNKKHHSKKFDLTGIYKFEVNLAEDQIKCFCKDPDTYSFFKQYSKIQDITFNPCIELLSESNSIILFFTRKNTSDGPPHTEIKNKTRKRVKFAVPSSTTGDNHSKTSKKYT